jgi:hypothetical protein
VDPARSGVDAQRGTGDDRDQHERDGQLRKVDCAQTTPINSANVAAQVRSGVLPIGFRFRPCEIGGA